MKCELCGTEGETTLVALITGKRGRPPHKNYCASCIESENAAGRCKPAPTSESKAERERFKEAARVKKPKQKSQEISGIIYPAAAFLFRMNYVNLFEPVNAGEWGDHWLYRCKACKAEHILKRTEREAHWLWHRGQTPVETSNPDPVSEEEIEDAA